MAGSARRAAIAAAVLLAMVTAACVPLTGLGAGHTLTYSTYRLGPFDLAAMGEPGDQSQANQANVPRPAGDLAIHDLDFDVVMEDGTPVPSHDVHLHHVLLFEAGASDPLCPGWPLTFGGSGSERTPIRLWSDYAYRVGSTDQWNSTWHVMNMMDMPMEVYIEYRVGYDNDTGSNHRGVTPYFMDVTGCGGGVTWDVPGNGGPGSIQTTTRDWVAPTNGVAVYGGTHLHDGGIDGSVARLSDGLVGCKGTAAYHMGDLMSINPCMMHLDVTAGQTYRQTIRYDNSEFHDDVMGIHLFYVWHGTPPPP